MVEVRVLDGDRFDGARHRRVSTTLPAAPGQTCPLCAAPVDGAVMVDVHDPARIVGPLDLFTEPSGGASVEFSPCGCLWESRADERVFAAVGGAAGVRFTLVERGEGDGPDSA